MENSVLYTYKIIGLMSDDDGDEVEMDLHQLGQYIKEGRFTKKELHHLLSKTLLPCLQYRAVGALLFGPYGLFKEVVQGFKFYSEETCMRLLCAAVLNKRYQNEDHSEDQKLVINKALDRLEKLDALKKNAATLVAILKYGILNYTSLGVMEFIIPKLPDLDRLPVFDRGYFPQFMRDNEEGSSLFCKGFTLLMSVIMAGEKVKALVDLLLECGADPDATSKNNSTPLMVACMRNNLLTFRKLPNKQANLHQMNNQGMDAIAHAIKYSSWDILLEILQSRDFSLNRRDNKDNSRLIFLYQNTHVFSHPFNFTDKIVLIFDFLLLEGGIHSLEYLNQKGESFWSLYNNGKRIFQKREDRIQERMNEIKVQYPWLCIDQPVKKLKKIAETIKELVKNGMNLFNCYRYLEVLRIVIVLYGRFPFFSTLFDQQTWRALMRTCISKYMLINAICCFPNKNNKKENLSHSFLGLSTDVFSCIYAYSFSVYDGKHLNIFALYEKCIKQKNTNKKNIQSHWINKEEVNPLLSRSKLAKEYEQCIKKSMTYMKRRKAVSKPHINDQKEENDDISSENDDISNENYGIYD